MVGPSLSEEEQEANRTRLKAGFVLLVGVSAGMIAVQGNASLPSVLAVVAAGVGLGVLLVYYLSLIVP
jgi:hypothetical protein